MPAAPSSDFLTPLRASGLVMRLFDAAVSQRLRQATFWRHLRPSDPVKRLFGITFAQTTPPERLFAVNPIRLSEGKGRRVELEWQQGRVIRF